LSTAADGSSDATMPTPTPTPGAPEPAAVRAMFDRIAGRYDLLNHLLSAGVDVLWRRRALDALELRPPARVLDLCTGTGDLLIEALRREPLLRGVGIDLSREMLARGAGKLRARGLASRSALAAAAAEQLPFRGDAFDAACVAFGVRNVADIGAALRELRRVLRPGGRLLVLEFSEPAGLLAPVFRLYFRFLLPRLAGLLSDGPAYAYLPASVARFPSLEAFAGLMREAGFGSVAWRRLSGGIASVHQGTKPA
jgi:demethylmenaquinone methyltransferase / 2-methoxy-6-polyprenyl-1,4-benzoquinol methylase